MTDTVQHRITVIPYNSRLKEEWDSFVEKSRNGTFLHKRGYMEYHSDRFADHSLMFYNCDVPVAVLPAHIKDSCLCSHNGLTYGGLLLTEGTTAENRGICSDYWKYARGPGPAGSTGKDPDHQPSGLSALWCGYILYGSKRSDY